MPNTDTERPARPAQILSGLYVIENTATGDYYLGATSHFRRRWSSHRSKLLKEKHNNPRLQAAWSHYGPEAFAWLVIARLPREEAFLDEAQLLARLVGEPRCYNASAEPWLGLFGDAVHQKRSRKGIPRTPEERAKISAALRGRALSPEHRAKVAAAGMGRVKSPETCEKLRASATGKRHTEASKAKMRAANLGRRHTPEWCAQHSAALLGHTHSPETRAKLAEAARRSWRERKTHG